MADFLSDDWFAALNETLRAAPRPPLGEDSPIYRIVLELADGPSTAPHALTLTVAPEGAYAEPGDHLAADTVVRLTYSDARALTNGELASGDALRDGRLKVRGDVHALVPLLAWLLEAHAGGGPSPSGPESRTLG